MRHTAFKTDAVNFAGRRRFIIAAALASGCGLHAQVALAQDTPPTADATAAPGDQVQEVVVTAQRREENIQTVPLTINAFSGAALQSKGVDTIADIGLLTPGLTFSTLVGYAIPYLRGVGSTSTGPGFENPVAIYVDGVYYAAQGGALLSLNNIASVEVAKGPQGTLFGRNSTGGAINIRTKTPSHDFSGLVRGGYGNYDTSRGALYVTGGLSSTVAADLAIDFMNQGDGYGSNLTLGTDLDRNSNVSARSKVLFTPSDDTEITLAADISRTRGRPALLPAPGTRPRGNRPAAANPRDGYGDSPTFSIANQWGGSLTVRQQIGAAKLLSITAYRDTYYHGRFDNTLTDDPSATFFVDTVEPHTQFSQELQLVSDDGGSFDWVVGAYFLRERASYNELTAVGGGSLGLPAPLEQRPDTRSTTGAGFVEGTYELAPGTKLTGGLRYTYEQRKLDATQVLFLPGFSLTFASDEKQSYKQLTWRVAATQQIAPDILGYISWNRGFKAGGFNTSTYDPTISYRPEKIDAYEVGLKSELFNRRLRLNLSGFYYDYTDLQITSFPDGSLIVSNAPKARIYGLDLDAELAVTSQFRLTGGLEALNTEYLDFKSAPFSQPRLVPVGRGGTIFTEQPADGKQLSKAPPITFNIGGEYRREIGLGTLSASAVYSYSDRFFGDPDNRLRQPAYSVVNASIELQTASGFGVKIWGKNLTDTRYAVTIAAQTQGDYVQYADPMTYGVTLTKKF